MPPKQNLRSNAQVPDRQRRTRARGEPESNVFTLSEIERVTRQRKVAGKNSKAFKTKRVRKPPVTRQTRQQKLANKVSKTSPNTTSAHGSCFRLTRNVLLMRTQTQKRRMRRRREMEKTRRRERAQKKRRLLHHRYLYFIFH